MKCQPKPPRAACIQKATWQLADWGVLLYRAGRASTREVHKAGNKFHCTLQVVRRQRVQVAGANIEG